jgi:hypothetical protein
VFAGLLVASGVGLLALPALTRRLGRRLAPREWAILCTVAIGGGALAIEGAAVFVAAPTVLRAVGVPALASACERMLGPLTPGGPVAGWAATGVAATIAAFAALGVVRAERGRRAVRVGPGVGEHRPLGSVDLVVLPSRRPIAVTVPGDRGQIVISDGLVAALSPEQLDAVIRHERAHLTHRHHRYLTLAAAVEQAFVILPPVRRSTATLRLALERWADEEAASGGPEARRALHAALLAVVEATLASPALAALAAPDGIIERLDALSAAAPQPPLTSHAFLYTPGTLLGGTMLVAVGSWAGAARALLAMAGRCPS